MFKENLNELSLVWLFDNVMLSNMTNTIYGLMVVTLKIKLHNLCMFAKVSWAFTIIPLLKSTAHSATIAFLIQR
jgi:hypothetical protein